MTKIVTPGSAVLEIYIPLSLHPGTAEMDEAIQGALELHSEAGFDTFMLAAPSKGWRSIGYPPREHFHEIAEGICRFRRGVEASGVRVGWWNTLTLKTGPAEYQRIVFLDGRSCPTSTCPLDERFQERFAGDVALVAREAAPALVFFEDDLGLNCHGGPACFCELHLRAFAERVGRLYSRDELRDMLAGASVSATSLRREWEAVSRDSLVQLARRVRQAVDAATPCIPMGTMQPGCADRDGDSTEAVARAFAGARHAPFVRLYGTSYGSDDPLTLPRDVAHALYSLQHLPADVVCYHESDTYPHNRFFMSAGKMRSLMAAVYSYGFAGSTFQVCQHLDDANEETGYREMFAAERPRFETLVQWSRRCRVSGCGLLSAPAQSNEWVTPLAHFGIPCTSLEGPVNALSGALPDHLSDAQLAALLKKGLLLDGEAAQSLCARGYGEAIGVSVQGRTAFDAPGRDLEGRERIRPAFLRRPGDGRLMTWFSTFAPQGNGALYHLEPRSSSTETVTDLLDFRKRIVGPGMTRFVNADGGRVVVMAMSVTGNRSSSLLNYRRSRLIQDQLVWAGAQDLLCVLEQPRVFCILNRPSGDSEEGLRALVTLINLCSDALESVELRLPRDWVDDTAVTWLDAAGQWSEAACTFDEHSVRLHHPLPLYHPLYLRFAERRQAR